MAQMIKYKGQLYRRVDSANNELSIGLFIDYFKNWAKSNPHLAHAFTKCAEFLGNAEHKFAKGEFASALTELEKIQKITFADLKSFRRIDYIIKNLNKWIKSTKDALKGGESEIHKLVNQLEALHKKYQNKAQTLANRDDENTETLQIMKKLNRIDPGFKVAKKLYPHYFFSL